MIKIIIEGSAGSGKTTLADAIETLLKSFNMDVSVMDIDKDLNCDYPHLQHYRIAALADRKVKITTIQLQK